MAFHRLINASEQKYGTSAVRPQDLDKDMMIIARRNNHGVLPPIPNDYMMQVILSSDIKITVGDPATTKARIEWVDCPEQTEVTCRNLETKQYVGVDFEFHNKDSFEGFICVTSLASKDRTVVVDSLYRNRKSAIESIANILQNPRVLKIFCGADNDLIRVKKDWNCFPVNVLDLQDLFVLWKTYGYSECFQSCSEIIKEKIWKEKSRAVNEFEVNDYLRNYNKPSLEFLVRVLLHQPVQKNKLATMADYRRRPLHPDLINYSGNDARLAFDVFECMAKKIKEDGIHLAIDMSRKKLVNFSAPPSHKCLQLFSTGTFGTIIQSWREYLSINLDKNPELLISNENVKDLIQQITSNSALRTDEVKLSDVLADYKLADDCTKAARLLIAYLDPNQTEFKKMKNIVCHRCNKIGHTAFFCFTVFKSYDELKTARQNYRSRNENMVHNIKQSKRRWENYCSKRGLNPDSATKPWAETN